jgi:Arc/MetJ-type ribon-helix-helix transcriptional regulator
MHLGGLVHMSTRIAIRLPDEIVAYLDGEVAAGRVPSRAAFVTSALEREIRRQIAQRDAEILRSQGSGDELDDVVVWTVEHMRPGR